jgi:hypothetical protein
MVGAPVSWPAPLCHDTRGKACLCDVHPIALASPMTWGACIGIFAVASYSLVLLSSPSLKGVDMAALMA